MPLRQAIFPISWFKWTKSQKNPGANPTTVSYNASVVKIYNATSSLVRFENKIVFIYVRKNALA
jgi:hypothetical protein